MDQKIHQGEYIGNIIPWPTSSYGETYNHIHLLIVDGKGRYINPFKLLPKLEDTSLPKINSIGLFDAKRRYIKGNRVQGKHGIYINASDTVLHQDFILTPYSISYKLDGLDEVIVWKFDFLPSVNNDQDFINDFYLPKTCGNYTCRDFYINLNFNTKSKNATSYFNLKPGEHRITVFVSDFIGNKVSQNFKYIVYE